MSQELRNRLYALGMALIPIGVALGWWIEAEATYWVNLALAALGEIAALAGWLFTRPSKYTVKHRTEL